MSIPAHMDCNVENALALCGRDRVLHRDDATPSVAIRWDGEARLTAPDGTERYLRRDGKTLSEAGSEAALAFAKRIREESQRLASWANSIETASRGGR